MMKRFVLLFISFLFLSIYVKAEEIKFLVFADLHYDYIPDGEKRMREIMESAEKNKVSFIIDLGDFAPAQAESIPIKRFIDSFSIPVYHVLGNHDLDKVSKSEYIQFWNIPSPYYYVDKGNFRFIFMDSGFYRDKDNNIVSYEGGNYKTVKEADRNKYGEEQLKWLNNVIEDKNLIYVIFSHAPINDQYDRIVENRDVHNLLVNKRKEGMQIALTFGGHIHSDNYHVIDSLHYIQINSASYIWGGEKFRNTERYSPEVYNQYPVAKFIIPFVEPLYAIVHIDSSGKINITGIKSKYVKPKPDEELLKTKPYPCSPEIQSRYIEF